MATLRKITLNWEIRTGAITCDTGYIKRQELCDVDLYVTVDGTPYALDTSWGLNLSVKPALLGDNAALVAVTTWTASATTGLYQATAQTIGGTALDTYLAANNADTTDDEGNKLVDLDVYYTVSMAMRAKSDTVTVICKPDVGRTDDTVPATIVARNDFLVSNGTGLLVNVAAGYAANGAFVAAQASLAITNATNYIEVTAAGVASVNTTAFTAGSYPLATVVASAGAITANTDLRAWITPKPAAAGGVTSITGTANEITVTGTTTPTLSLPTALTFTGKTVTNGTFNSGAFNGTLGATTPSTVAGTTGTFSGAVSTTGNAASIFTTANQGTIYTLGNFSDIYTTGADSTIFTQGADATINTEGANANIYTVGLNANIYTSGANAHIYTSDAGAYIQTRSTFKLNGGTYTTTLSHAATANRAIEFPDAAGTLALVSGNLGTPSAIVLTNATGTAASLTAGNVTTNANLTGHVTSTGNAAVLGSFTMAQLSTAVSDGDPAYVGAANTFTGTTNTFTLPTTSGTTTTSGIAVAGNSLTTGTGIYAASSTLTSGKLLDLQVSGTAAAASQTALNVATAGANGTSGITSKGAVISNTHTGTTSTNVALELTASGGTTANYAINSTAGDALFTVSSGKTISLQVADGSLIPAIILNSTNASNRGQAIRFQASGSNMWGFGCDFSANGTKNFWLYDYTDSKIGMFFAPTTAFVCIGSPTNSASQMNVAGNCTIGSGIIATVAPTNGLQVEGNTIVGGTLAVTGATTLTGNLTSNGALISTPQALSGAGAVNVTTLTTAVTTTAPAQALTLANGTNGQIKTIVHQALSGGGTWVLTPTTKTGYTTITSTAAGETCTLQFFTTIGWCILSLRGAIAA